MSAGSRARNGLEHSVLTSSCTSVDQLPAFRQALLVLKNQSVNIKLKLLAGDSSLHDLFTSGGSRLEIKLRTRFDQGEAKFARQVAPLWIALVESADPTDTTLDDQIVKYFIAKSAVGIISTPSLLAYVFPTCGFAVQRLQELLPRVDVEAALKSRLLAFIRLPEAV